MKFWVHYRNGNSQGKIQIDAKGKRDAMRIAQDRMTASTVTRAERA